MKKLLPLSNLLALLGTITVSYFSVTGIFNGNTMATQSARYPTLFTPAPWAFSIWGLIYIALLLFTIYQLRRNEEIKQLQDRIGGWFLLSCVANSGWVIAWMYDQTGLSVVIMLILLFSLAKIIWRTDMELTDPPLRTIAFIWWPFSLYAGWITVATLTNISAWLVSLQWIAPGQPQGLTQSHGFGLSPTTWAIALCILAGAIYLFMTWRRNMREYAFVGVWALIAVARADHERAPAVTTTAYIIAAILFLSSSYHGYRNRAYSPFRKR